MKRSVTLAALCLSSIAASTSAQAIPASSCADHVSYAVTPGGRCVDLSSFTQLSAIRDKIADLNRQIDPLSFNGLKIRDQGKENYYLNGNVVNQSRQTVNVISFQIDLTTKRDGDVVVVKSVEVPFGKTILPGQSAAVEYPLGDKSLSEGMSVVFKSAQTF